MHIIRAFDILSENTIICYCSDIIVILSEPHTLYIILPRFKATNEDVIKKPHSKIPPRITKVISVSFNGALSSLNVTSLLLHSCKHPLLQHARLTYLLKLPHPFIKTQPKNEKDKSK